VSHASAWSRLGIERTDDLTAIRKAYAKRLKETDVEADPRAFISLREARDLAMAYARSPAEESALEEADEGFLVWDDEQREPDEPWSPSPAAPSVAPTAWVDEEAEARRARFEELQSLLFADSADAPDPERMRLLLREILADPEMQSLDHSDRIEPFLAWAAASAGPRADPIVADLVEHFRWEDRYDDWDQTHEVIALVQRYRALLFRQVALPPGSPYHAAWLELTGTGPKLGWDRYLVAGRVAKLLTIVRDHSPAAEDLLNPYRVALWDEHLEGSIKRYMIVALFVFGAAFLIARFAGS
jgi:hypothetical protein